jgi:hypothetical protein
MCLKCGGGAAAWEGTFMKILSALLFLTAGFCTQASQAEASARQFYLDLMGTIDQAEARARLGLDSGTWRSTLGETEIKWVLQKSTSAVANLDYNHGLLQRGQIIFDDPLLATVRRTVGGQPFCVTFKIKRIDYSEQGFIDPTSDLNPQPASPDCNARAGRPELQRIAAISDNLQEVFSGRLFLGMGKLGRTVRCVDANCTNTTPDTGPINSVQLLGTENVVKLFGGRDINFPTGGQITTDAGSQLKIGRLYYDVPSESIDGQIDDATLNISAGHLKAGTTELTFAGGGGIQNAGIKFVKTGGTAEISGGRMTINLGPNTVIDLLTHPSYPSQISLNRAKAKFSDLRLSFTGAAMEIGARYANLEDIQVSGADIAFSESNSLSIGPTSFGALLGCDEQQAASDQCLGFSWSAGKPNLIGRISGLNATLRSGTFALSNGGKVNLAPGGTVTADNIYIDTRRLNSAKNPIRGRFTKFMADLTGQALAIDKDNTINTATVHLQSSDLTFVPEDKYPTGSLSFDGSLTGASNGTFGNVPMANATVSFLARRDVNGPVAISNGKVRGNAVVRDGAAIGNITVALDNVVFSAGYGRADVSVDITSASYTIDVPQEKKPGKNIDWDRKEIIIPLSLLDPINITNQPITIEANRWKVPDIMRTFRVGFSLKNEELLYLLAHKDIGIAEPKCSMKVKYVADSYVITGQLKLVLGGGNNAFSIDTLNLDKGIAVDPDLGSCDDVIDVACGLVGNVAMGPIGAVAAAMICQKKVDNFLSDLSSRFKDYTKKKVNDLRFRASF